MYGCSLLRSIGLMFFALCLAAPGGLLPAQAKETVRQGKPEAKAAKGARLVQNRGFAFHEVVEKARHLAKAPFKDPRGEVPDFLLNLDYDAWRSLRFRPDKSLWRGEKLPFEVQFFHPGFVYDRTVAVNVVEDGRIQRLPFNRGFFDYGKQNLSDQVPKEMNYAGFRLHGAINTKKYYDEFLVFLGASYFRAVAKGQGYGLSARGLAVDCGASRGEEFPYFREFWLVRPGPKDETVTLYALLDSVSVCGAYAFTVNPGQATTLDVKSVVFLRRPVEKLGIAPLTSMFLHGENTSPNPFDDYRPEVHDSDGLSVHFASGEWLWRPLSNPRGLLISAFEAPDVAGFGLMQRDDDFRNYQDLEARYEKRPSLWIAPRGKWGPGRVELVLIPSDKEIHDNMVASFVPSRPLPLNEPLEFDYLMSWEGRRFDRPPGGYVTATRTSRADNDKRRRFVVDFEGKALEALSAEAPVQGMVSVGQHCKLVEKQVIRNEATGGWRLVFVVEADGESLLNGVLPDKRPPVELRAFLQNGSSVLTETWTYALRF